MGDTERSGSAAGVTLTDPSAPRWWGAVLSILLPRSVTCYLCVICPFYLSTRLRPWAGRVLHLPAVSLILSSSSFVMFAVTQPHSVCSVRGASLLCGAMLPSFPAFLNSLLPLEGFSWCTGCFPRNYGRAALSICLKASSAPALALQS